MKRLFIPILALVVAVLACGPFGGSEPDVAEIAAPEDGAEAGGEDAAAEAGEDTAEEVEEPAEESGSDAPGTYLFSGLGLDDHNSFSFEFAGHLTPIDPSASSQEVSFEGTMTLQRDPEVATWEFGVARPEGEGENGVQFGSGGIVGYLVDGVVYSILEVNGAETCVGIPETGDTLDETMDIFMGPDTFNDPKYHTEDLTLVETGVEVNGFITNHYHGENINNDEFENGTVDLWVAQDEDVPVRMMVTGQGEDDTYGEVNIEWNYNLVGLDQPVEVTVPDNCSVMGGDS